MGTGSKGNVVGRKLAANREERAAVQRAEELRVADAAAAERTKSMYASLPTAAAGGGGGGPAHH